MLAQPEFAVPTRIGVTASMIDLPGKSEHLVHP
jgi:hypothetical protein